jgi:hypothetical protein
MSSASETYITIGKTCVDQIEEAFKHKLVEAQAHTNEIVNLNRRVQHLCTKIGNKKTQLTSSNAVNNLIQLNKELYRAIFAEEPPQIDGHNLHVAITLLERICVLMLQNDVLTMMRRRPSIVHS